ncbi:MAG: hypothetical protein IIW80_11555 [Treponema sp.]|nr:hypothetical protein [Treponema sp.]
MSSLFFSSIRFFQHFQQPGEAKRLKRHKPPGISRRYAMPQTFADFSDAVNLKNAVAFFLTVCPSPPAINGLTLIHTPNILFVTKATLIILPQFFHFIIKVLV